MWHDRWLASIAYWLLEDFNSAVSVFLPHIEEEYGDEHGAAANREDLEREFGASNDYTASGRGFNFNSTFSSFDSPRLDKKVTFH